MMNKRNESKKRTALMNGITVDWQYAQQLIPTVLSESQEDSAAFRESCNNLKTIFEDIENSVNELKACIPYKDI